MVFRLICLSILLFAGTYTVSGQTGRPHPGKVWVRLVKATSQRTLPGRKEGEVMTAYRIVMSWKGKQPPQTFFWYAADGSWQTAAVTRLKGDYSEQIDLTEIKKGDTLELVPMRGRDIKPRAVTATLKRNILFTVNGRWFYYPIKNFTKLADVPMP